MTSDVVIKVLSNVQYVRFTLLPGAKEINLGQCPSKYGQLRCFIFI